MNALDGKTKFWVTFGVTALAVFAFFGVYLFGVYYVYSSWRILVESRREVAGLEKTRSEVLSASHLLSGLEREHRLVEASFADPANPLPLFESVEDLGRRFNVEVGLREGAVKSESGREYAIEASGSFRGIMPFIKGLESLPLLVELGETSLSAAGARTGFQVGGSAPPKGGSGPPEPTIELKIKIKTIVP